MPYAYTIKRCYYYKTFWLSLVRRSEVKWKNEINAKKRSAADAKLNAARAVKCTLEVERKLAEVKEELVEVTHQLEMEKARGQGLIERAERAEEALQAERIYSRQEVKGELVQVNHQLEMEKTRGQRLIEHAERAEEALQADRVYSRQGRTVLYL